MVLGRIQGLAYRTVCIFKLGNRDNWFGQFLTPPRTFAHVWMQDPYHSSRRDIHKTDSRFIQRHTLDFRSDWADLPHTCLLYTSDAADDLLCVDLGGRRIIKKKKLHK